MALFTHKTASSAPEDVNAGAGSLRYEEVRPRSSPSDNFRQATTLQFDFSSAGRHVLLSESYFEIQFRAGMSEYASGGNAGAIEAIPSASVLGGTGVSTEEGMKIALRSRFFNSCISNVRHSINGSQISSNNECASSCWLNDQCTQSYGYSTKAASAFFSQNALSERQKQTALSTTHTCAYSPPLGVWSSPVAIPGSANHSLQFDVMAHASYSQRIFEVINAGTALDDDQFMHFYDTTTVTAQKQRFYTAIDSVVLRLATVSAQDMRIAPENMVIETREIECQRIGAGLTSTIARQITVPGSLYKLSAHFVSSDGNDHVTGIGEPELPATTDLTRLSLTVDGQSLQNPEYSLSQTHMNVRPYIDMLSANGLKDNQEGSSMLNLGNWSNKPFYLARVVQPVTNSKEVLLRSTHSQSDTAKTAILASWYTQRILLEFDANGNCINVMTNA